MRLMYPHPAQERVLRGLGHPKAPQFIQVRCGRRWGKAIRITCPILTTTGWSTMGQLEVGQYVFAPDGTPTRIQFCSDVMYGHKCYRVTLSDGSTIDADAEHNWVTWTITKAGPNRGKRIPGIVTTEQMAHSLRKGKRGDLVHAIALTQPLEFPEQELPMDPYTLGAWLGDGDSSGGAITGIDKEVWENIEKAGYAITGRTDPQRHGILGLQGQLRVLGVLNNKHVPDMYLRGSIPQRLALLQGLMDTDGCVDPNGHCEFTNKNEKLSAAIVELCRSFGMKPTMGCYEAKLYGKSCGNKYRVHFTPPPGFQLFRIARKQQRLDAIQTRRYHKYRMVTAVEEIPSEPVRCISVEHPSHLFLAGRGLVATHNTSLGRLAALKVCVDWPEWSRLRMGKELILADYPMPKRVMIICPDKSQAKELYWDALLEDLDGNPLVDKTNSTSLTVTFKGNRPQLMLKGANDREGDTIRGSDIPFGVFDEFQDWNMVAFNKVVTPAMASTTKSQAVIMGTPKGKGTNPMYLIYRMAEEMPDQCHSYHFYTMDNPAISRDEIARAKATMPERDFREEFMASFEDFPGRIFSELDHTAVITIPQPSVYGVSGVRGLGIDWGDVNPAFTVWEFGPGEHGVITYLDGWVNPRDTPVTFAEQKAIIRALCMKYNVKLIRCDPSRPAEILELQQEGERYGIEGMRNSIAGDNAVKSGNAYVHSVIHQGRLRILTDPSSQQLDGMYIFDRLVAYHRKQLRDGSFVDEVAPGQDDHVCDATRYILFNPA